MSKKFLRSIRLDGSDADVFESAAEPGEWLTPGAFMFLADDDTSLSGKRQQAFRNGFLGIGTFGWSTLAEIANVSDDEYQQIVEQLADRIVEHLGAPSREAALDAAREEARYTQECCEYDAGTLIALSREMTDEGISENLHRIQVSAGSHDNVKIWDWVKDASDE